MKNTLRVFWRDVKRLIKVPQAWSVVLFLMVLPSLYTWFNVAGFWDPYENTGNLRVCVVNEDEGVSDELLGDLNLGEQIAGQLAADDQLGWAFMTRDEAMGEIEAGEAYAAFVIPADFSADVATIVTEDFEQPRLEYYVNEKIGPVAPKITDTGANTLETTINDKFISTVSSVVVDEVASKVDESIAYVDAAKESALSKVDEAIGFLAESEQTVQSLSDSVSQVASKAATAQQALADAQAKLDSLSEEVQGTTDVVGKANSGIAGFTTKASSALDSGTAELTRMAGKTEQAATKASDALLEAKAAVDEASAADKVVAEGYADVAELAKRLRQDIPEDSLSEAQRKELDEILARLEEGSSSTVEMGKRFDEISAELSGMASDLDASSDAVDSSVQDSIAKADEFRTSISNDTVSELSGSLSSIATATSSLKSAVESQRILVDEAMGVLEETESTLDMLSGVLVDTGKAIDSYKSELSGIRTDVAGLNGAEEIRGLLSDGKIDPDAVADFMLSPTTVKTEKLYPINAYGSAMAPLFINLTLWIGVFMLMVIFRDEVDDEGIERLTITQRYFGRGILLALIAAAQAIVCCTGCLVLGVQCASVVAFYVTAIVCSLSYLAIQYTLSSTFQHLGKAMCVVLVFVQIPGATGLYPIEMMPEFFRMIYPMFPFTYGINAIRETLCGFYGNHLAVNLGMLALFFAVFVFIAVLVKPHMANLNRMFARQLGESDMLLSEESLLPARRYRYTQVLRALADREEYRTKINARTEAFMSMYPTIKQATVFVGIVVPIIVTAVLGAIGIDKVIILTMWLVWFIVVILFALAIDYVQDSLTHQLSLESMSDDQVRTLYSERQEYTHVQALKPTTMSSQPDSSERISVQLKKSVSLPEDVMLGRWRDRE